MEFLEFKKLLQRAESASLDFKLTCNAFNKQAKDHDRANAELVKDICAMANNGSTTSYLVIGVGDDRTTFRSVDNTHLTTANIQNYVRKAIHPAPEIRVHDECWKDVSSDLDGKRFVIIQVGPNARQAFRISRDLGNYRAGYCFRANEVWVRNDDTCGLATPEQILVLAGKARRAERKPDYDVVDYGWLPLVSQHTAMLKDLRAFWRERGCSMHELPQSQDEEGLDPNAGFRVVVRIRSKDFVFRCGVWRDMSARLEQVQACPVELSQQPHGTLLQHGLQAICSEIHLNLV